MYLLFSNFGNEFSNRSRIKTEHHLRINLLKENYTRVKNLYKLRNRKIVRGRNAARNSMKNE